MALNEILGLITLFFIYLFSSATAFSLKVNICPKAEYISIRSPWICKDGWDNYDVYFEALGYDKYPFKF